MSSDSTEPTLAVGIDLGTTYSAVAYIDDTGRPVTLVNAEGDLVTPSVVLFEGHQPVVGKEALKALATEAEHVAQCAKRELGDRAFHKSLQGAIYPPEALQALVLNKLRQDAVRQIGEFKKVVITVPAYFDEVRRKATQDAGYMAGFEVLDIINEPTAAAIAHGFLKGFLNRQGESNAPRKLLVYDLGGGTFDVTVMEIQGNDFAALATDGDVQLGGHDWDHRLVDYVAEEFKRQFELDPREDPNTLGRLWRESEDAKRTLSARTKVSISCDYKGHAVRVEVTREQFEELTHDLLDRTQFTTKQTLQAAGLGWNDLDQVLLVGGSTRMPMVAAMLRKVSGKEPDASVSVDEAVAHGAALHANVLLRQRMGQRPVLNVKNVNSHSLGVVATDARTSRKSQCDLDPAQHAAADHGQASVSHTEAGPEINPGADRRGRERLARGLLADRPLRGPRPARGPAGPDTDRSSLCLPGQRAADRERDRGRHRPRAAPRDHPRQHDQPAATRRLAAVCHRPGAQQRDADRRRRLNDPARRERHLERERHPRRRAPRDRGRFGHHQGRLDDHPRQRRLFAGRRVSRGRLRG